MLEIYRKRLGSSEFEQRAFAQSQRGLKKETFLDQLHFTNILNFLLGITGLTGLARKQFLDVQIVRQTWEFPNLPTEFDGLRILQSSPTYNL